MCICLLVSSIAAHSDWSEEFNIVCMLLIIYITARAVKYANQASKGSSTIAVSSLNSGIQKKLSQSMHRTAFYVLSMTIGLMAFILVENQGLLNYICVFMLLADVGLLSDQKFQNKVVKDCQKRQ